MRKKIVAMVFAVLIMFFLYYFAETMKESHREEAIETSTGQEKQESQEVLEETKESEIQRYYQEAVESAKLEWEWVIQPGEYDDVTFLGGTYIAVREENGKYRVIDENGDFVFPEEYDLISPYSDNLARVCNDGMYFYIDKMGKKVIKGEFQDAKSFWEKKAAVQMEGRWGYIDGTGQVVIELMYDDVGNFSEGKAAVKFGDYTEDGLDAWAYINSENKVMLGYYIDWQIPAFSMYASEFHDGLAYIVEEVPTIINEKGEKIFDSPFFITGYADPKYKAIPGYLFTDDLMKERRYGLVGVDGQCLLEPVFYDVDEPYEDYVRVEMLVDEIPLEGVIRLKK